MARKFTLRDTSEGDEGNDSDAHMIDRRQFMRHSFNTAAGVITMAGLTSVGFVCTPYGPIRFLRRGHCCQILGPNRG